MSRLSKKPWACRSIWTWPRDPKRRRTRSKACMSSPLPPVVIYMLLHRSFPPVASDRRFANEKIRVYILWAFPFQHLVLPKVISYIDHNYSQQWTMLTTYENAHKSGKCLQFTNMLTTCENTHNLRKCSQLAKMLTLMTYKNACENAHNLRKCYNNLWKCSQPRISITTCKNAHIFQENTKHLYTSVEVLPERLQHLTPAMLHLSQTCEPGPIANGHDFPWLRRAVPFCYIFCTTRGAGPQNRDVVYLFNSRVLG